MRARIVLGMITALVASAVGNVGAATGLPAVPTTPSDPTLALAALDRKIADLDSEEASSKKELTVTGALAGAVAGRLVAAPTLPIALATNALIIPRTMRALIP